jgi:TP901 family phage tail tape measure protein
MSEIFAEATVRLTPDVTGFATELKKQLKAAIETSVEPTTAARVRIRPALTRDFIGDLRRQVNTAVTAAQKGLKPIQIRAVLSDVSKAAIAREIRTGAQTVRATTPVGGGRAAAGTGAAVAATRDLATATLGLANVEKILATAEAQRIPLLGTLSAEEAALAKVRAEGARTSQASATALGVETQASHTLALAKAELAVAENLEIGTSQRAAAIRRANRLAVESFTQAQLANDAAGAGAATALRNQIRSLEGAEGALNETSRAAARAASNMSQLRRGVLSTSLSFLGIRGATLAASARFLIAAAAVATFAKAVTSAAETATQLNVFRATTQSTADEMERVGALARELGADLSLPGVTALDAAQAMTELAKAGLSTQDAMDGARGVLQLATAAAIDNAQATELAANAINAFGLAGRDATRVADVFANAANAAQGSIVDIGIAFQQASAAGRQVGLSFEDTSTFLTVLARNGLRGSDAGTSLRTALIRLIKPTKDAAEKMRELGIETRDAAGNLRPDIFIQITQALSGVSKAERDATIALIGGQDAFRAITILGRQSIGEFIRLRRELREQGTAAELAEARMTGLRGAMEGLGNTLSSIGLRAGQTLTPALQGVVEGVTGATVGLADSQAAAQTFSGVVDALEISLSGLGQALTAVGAVALPVAGSLAAVTNAVGIPTILAAVAAYKLLPPAFLAARVAAAAFTTTMVTLNQVGFGLAARGAITAMISSLNLYVIAAAAVAAGLFFLITRETAAERARRRLTEATDELVTAQGRLASTRTESRGAGLQINAAELGVLEAQQAVARARGEAEASRASKSTFERRKAAFELAVALDNVLIAQDAVSTATERANAANDEAAQAAINAESATAAQVTALIELTNVRRGLALIEGGRSSEQQDREAEAAQIKGTTDEILRQAAAAREEGSATSIALARRLELLATVANAIDELPTARTIEIAVQAPNLQSALGRMLNEVGATSNQIRDELFKGLTTIGTSPEVRAAIIDLATKLKIDLTAGARDAGNAAGHAITDELVVTIEKDTPKVLSAVGRLLAAVKGGIGQAAGLSVQTDLLAIASGATGATLPGLQAELANQQQIQRDADAAIARILARPSGDRTGLAAAREARRAAIAAQRQLTEAIRGINSSLASEAKAAQDEADQLVKDQKERQDKLFAAILEGMGIRRARRQERIEDAQLTEGVADDLRQTRILRRLAARQIQLILDRIEQARKQGKNVAVLIEGLRTLRGIWRDLGREVRALQKTRLEEIQSRIAENNQLDIEFAEITGNRNAEIRARLREIDRLRKLQDLAKKDIIERKRLRNLIAQQQKAIDDLRKQNDDRNNAFAQLTFSFLTTQQGFAANLLGNLLPFGAFGGTVAANLAARDGGGAAGSDLMGGGTGRFQGRPGMGGGGNAFPFGGTQGGPGRGIAAAAATAGAGVVAPPTRGQHSTTNQLLNQILQVLRHSDAGTRHPSSKRQQKAGSATHDTQ